MRLLVMAALFAMGSSLSADAAKMIVTTPAFSPNGAIPARYTCDGENSSPALEWTGVPKNAKSLALIVDDPDAPAKVWVHWVVYNMPATLKGLPEAAKKSDALEVGGKQGVTDFGDAGYGGPCPPSGNHRYYFKLYALSEMLVLSGKATKADVEKAMKGKILATATLMGTYHR
jgi:Raf kinase inhibitor-like YbhB/YbcL family protein